MTNFLKNLSIRNKIILSLVLVFIISAGIGIMEFNSLLKFQSTLSNMNVYSEYKTHLSNLQNNLYRLQVTVLNLSNSKTKDEFVKNSNDFKNIDIQVKNELNLLRNIDFKNIKSKNDLALIVNLNDSIFVIESTYEQRIVSSYTTLEEYINFTLQPKEVAQNYKTLLDEQINFGSISEYELKNKTESEIVSELLDRYRLSINDLKVYLLKTLNSQSTTIQRLQNVYIDSSNQASKYNDLKAKSLRDFIIIFIIFVGFIVLITFVISINILIPLLNINNKIKNLNEGEISEKFEIDRNDEIGLLQETLNSLIEYLNDNAKFAKELAEGEFDTQYRPKSTTDILRFSLINLKDSLLAAKREEQKRALEDYRRQRTAEAISKFADILRTYQNDFNVLSRELIINLVKFLKANQGMLFNLIEEEEEKYLKLISTYAWDREKFLEKRVEVGEGLIGSVAVDKFTVYMTDVPEDYIEIKSGTGSANPRSILITPLKVDNEILGVLEIASFNEFEKYEIQLVETIADNIASTLKSVRISAQTSVLLEKFQIQAFEMEEQEKSLKMTIEDLKKSEDSYKQKDDMYKNKLKDLEEYNKQQTFKYNQIKKQFEDLQVDFKLNNSKLENLNKQYKDLFETFEDPLFLINSDGNIEYANTKISDLFGFSEVEITGSSINNLFTDRVISGKNAFDYLIDNYDNIRTSSDLKFKVRTKENKTKEVNINILKFQTIDYNNAYIILFKDIQKNIAISSIGGEDPMDELLKDNLEKIFKIEFLEKHLLEQDIQVPEFSMNREILLEWNKNFELGIALIDKQHQKWIQFINELYKAIMQNSVEETLAETFKKLIEYTDYHFGFEEKYMKEFNFPFFDTHHLGHEKFINELSRMFNSYLISDKKDLPYKLILFLKDWVFNHVVKTDRRYVDIFRSHGLK